LSVSPPTITPYFETDHSAGNQHVPPSAPPSPAKTDRPVDDQTPLEQANALLAEDRIAAATSLLSRKLSEAKKIEQDAAWYVPACGLLARLYADQGQWAKARHWGQRAIELDTLQGEAYYVLALVDEQDDRFEAAIDNLKKVIYLDRTRPLPYFNLAMMYKKTAQPDRARQSLNNLSRILAGWPPEKAIPDTDGTTAAELLTVARQLLADLK
jgi:tetratricopeptide (TPR) repeat protein